MILHLDPSVELNLQSLFCLIRLFHTPNGAPIICLLFFLIFYLFCLRLPIYDRFVIFLPITGIIKSLRNSNKLIIKLDRTISLLDSSNGMLIFWNLYIISSSHYIFYIFISHCFRICLWLWRDRILILQGGVNSILLIISNCNISMVAWGHDYLLVSCYNSFGLRRWKWRDVSFNRVFSD